MPRILHFCRYSTSPSFQVHSIFIIFWSLLQSLIPLPSKFHYFFLSCFFLAFLCSHLHVSSSVSCFLELTASSSVPSSFVRLSSVSFPSPWSTSSFFSSPFLCPFYRLFSSHPLEVTALSSVLSSLVHSIVCFFPIPFEHQLCIQSSLRSSIL